MAGTPKSTPLDESRDSLHRLQAHTRYPPHRSLDLDLELEDPAATATQQQYLDPKLHGQTVDGSGPAVFTTTSSSAYPQPPPVPVPVTTGTISLSTPLQPSPAVGVPGHSRTNGTPVNGIQHTPVPVPPTTPATARSNMSGMTPGGEPCTLAPPPEGIYRTFEDLLTAVQRVAKDQGYGVVKLRASNYRDGHPTRYDLVCDRGGVKYNSTAKKRNPSTRKVDCPWRAKAVCEVQLGNQWRFQVQDSRHNHEARIPAAPPGQENTPLAQSIRSLTNKMDRIGHDMSQGFSRILDRLDTLDKRMVEMEQRVGTVEARLSGMESRDGPMEVQMDNLGMEGSMVGPAMM